MKRYVKPLLALVALIALVVVISTYFPDTFSSQETRSNNETSSNSNSTAGPKPSPRHQQSSDSIPRPSGATTSHVAHVHDGDTLFLQPKGTHSRDDQIKVRLIGLDTPEVGEFEECFGVEARDYLRRMLPKGTAVWTMPDREKFDRHGRSLLYLWTLDDRSVNLALVENGYATALNIAPSNTYWKQFDAAENVAYNAGAGLWSACYS